MINRIFFAVVFFLLLMISPLSAKEFSADVVTDMPMMQKTGKLYYKNSDISRNEIMGIINIMKRPLVYQVFANTKKYYVSNIDELQKDSPTPDMADFKQWAAQNNMKKVGKEKIENYLCHIYEGDIKSDGKQPAPHMKLWYSKELNCPLKTEIVLPEPGGTLSSLVKNIKIGKQPDSLFTVPAGYTQAKSMEEAMGMPNIGAIMEGQGGMNVGGGQEKGKPAPSPEELEKMMKQMQNMMKEMQKEQ